MVIEKRARTWAALRIHNTNTRCDLQSGRREGELLYWSRFYFEKRSPHCCSVLDSPVSLSHTSTDSMRGALMRLGRKRKTESKKELFDALPERNCMLRFTNYLEKRDDGTGTAYLNFWLTARMW
jgi:hypothetical protein